MTHRTKDRVPDGVPHQPDQAELEDLFRNPDDNTGLSAPAGHDSGPSALAARERRRDYRLADLTALHDGYYPTDTNVPCPGCCRWCGRTGRNQDPATGGLCDDCHSSGHDRWNCPDG